MAGLQSEIARLSNKDIRVRRRAIRSLFDEDNPLALPGFVPLLGDKDPWIRSKALDAHRKWAKYADDLIPLMDNHKRVAAELLENIDAPEIAMILLQESDSVTRSFAAQSLANETTLHSDFSNDEHHSVRMIAAEYSKDSELISSLIGDSHSSVRRSAIATASREGLQLGQDTLERGLSSSDPALRALVASLSVKAGGEMLVMACKDSNPKVRKAIAESLKTEVLQVDERITSIVDVCPEIIVRWLRSRHDPKASSLRWSMIENSKLNSRARSKLIEQMEGKKDIDTARLAIIAEDESALVRIAAMNLSASFAELGGEGS